MYFSNAYNIKNPIEEDWFDVSLDRDTPIFIDPMLVFQSKRLDFPDIGNKIKSFFKEALLKVAKLKGTKQILNNRDLNKMLEFKEPQELCLGYTNYGFSGRGIGGNFSNQIRNAMVELIELGLEEFGEYLSPFEMFVEGIGADRISDIIGNLIKKDLIVYTQNICKKNEIELKKFRVNNISFDEKLGWVYGIVELPVNPIKKTPIILVPKDFLRTNSYLDREDLYDYILEIENSDLRKKAAQLFTSGVTKESLRKAAMQDRELTRKVVLEYVHKRESEKAKPYDFRNDPEWLNELPKRIEEIIKGVNLIKLDNSFTLLDLEKFVEKIIEEFRVQVESNKGYLLLFDDSGKPRKEKISQVLFGTIASTICKNNNGLVDINPEAQTGRGPVDFKFSRGYEKRIVVEIKLAKSDDFYKGMEKQLPTYLESDQVDLGYYVGIKQRLNEQAKVAELVDRHSKLKLKDNKKIVLKIIDASKDSKISASRVT